MNQELIVTTQPPVLNTNYEALKAHLLAELEKYDVVVTDDTVKEAKVQATELNKLSAEIKSRVKAAVDEASAPIVAFKDQGKELDTLVQDTRQKIVDQVKVFEARKLAAAEAQMQEYLGTRFAYYQVRPEYRTATVEGMAKLTSLTGTGKLTSAACAEVDAKISECKALQQLADLRLSQLENECYRAGLHSPLTREHVEGILFAEEAKYQDALQGMIIRELDRQAETERVATAAAEKKLQDEQVAREAQQAPPAPVQAAPLMAAPTPAPEPDRSPAPSIQTGNKVRVRATCTFETFVSPGVSEQAIEIELRRVLEKAGIKSLVSVIVTKLAQKQEQAA